MKERRRNSWYAFGSLSDKKETKLVRYNIKPVGVYIRRYVVLLAWYGALSVRWERVIQERWHKVVEAWRGSAFIMDEEDY